MNQSEIVKTVFVLVKNDQGEVALIQEGLDQ